MEFDIMQAISTVGFPIAICVYTLLRSDKIQRQTTDALNALNTTVALLKESVETLKGGVK